MHSNMQPAMALTGIAWDQQWMKENYRSKDNYNIFKRGDWIRFLSMEFIKEALFIHTLQLALKPRELFSELPFSTGCWVKPTSMALPQLSAEFFEAARCCPFTRNWASRL